ncbi:MAG: ATP-dependent RNA helicase DbpA [Gammaproteobacteria bacterium]
MNEFSALNLAPPLARALTAVDYVEMTPVQAASLPGILAGRDVTVQAQTGSGKTAAFALGLLTTLDARSVCLQALVLCPTRELADQVSREIRRLARFIPNVKVLTLCGGVPLRIHLVSLEHEPHIAVGTPGRLRDLIERGALPLRALKALVLDEADRMLDMGFAPDLAEIVSRAPRLRQTMLFSATLPPAIRAIGSHLQRDPLEVIVAPNALTEQVFFEVPRARKAAALDALLRHYQAQAVLVFCNTRESVRAVASDLAARQFTVLALHGELDQRDREQVLVRFANRSCTVLVATDVAARGLDIADLPLVVNYDLANDPDTHLHRIGRTGRAGRGGLALSLCAPEEAARAVHIERLLGTPLRWDRTPEPANQGAPLPAPFVTLAIDGGREDKLRPGDLLGALTGDAKLPADAVGDIDVFPTRTYVAIAYEWHEQAAERLRTGKIKGRRFRARVLRN